MKVCFVTSNYPPEARGGTEQVTVALARELGARGVEVVVVSGSDQPHDGCDVRVERHEGTIVHRVFKTAEEWAEKAFVQARVLRLVGDLLARERPDVVHVHSCAVLGCGVTPWCRERGVPAVMTFHDQWVTCPLFFRLPQGGVACPVDDDRAPCVVCTADALAADTGFTARAIAERDRLVRAEVAAASACTAPSRTAADLVRRCLPYDGRIEVVPHGLVRKVAAADRAPEPVAGERLRIGTFGGLVAEKGVRELLAAAAPLDCELHLSGRLHGGGLAEELAARAAAGLCYRYHGPYGPEDPHPARNLHLAVFPSKCQETYGLVVDEALAHGVPVVCSDRGALGERRHAPGVCVTPLEALPETLADLIGSPQRLAALRAAIPAELPTIASSADRHLALYRSLV